MSDQDYEEKKPDFFLRLRGLPYSADDDAIRSFFKGINVLDIQNIHMGDGRPAGECYCEFKSKEDVAAAMEKNQKTMGNRYIELFHIGEVEKRQIVRRQKARKLRSLGCIRVRGLPFTCKKDDILTFFKDFNVEEVIFGKEPGEWGRPTGEAYVRFSSKQEAEKSLQLNGQHIGHRYLELFRVDSEAFELFKNRMTKNVIPLNSLTLPDSWGFLPYNYGIGGYGGGHAPLFYRGLPNYRYSPYDYYNRNNYGNYDFYRQLPEFISPTKLQMRGIPYRITPKEIEEFFEPLQCIEIKLGYFEDGRSTGDAIVEFSTMAEAREALKKDKETIGNRYIELFPSNTMKLPNGAFYKIVGGKMAGVAPLPAPLSATRYQW